MNGLERTLKAVGGEEADRVPMCPLLCYAAHRVLGIRCDEMAMDGELAAKSWIEAQRLCPFDAYCTLLDLTVEAHDFGQETKFHKTEVSCPNYDNPIVGDPQSYGNVKSIEACVTKGPGGFSRMAEYVKTMDILMNETGKHTAVVSFVFGTLGLLSMMRGAEHLFYDCVKHYDEVMKAQFVIQDVLLDYIDKICATGVHGVCLDTLFASGGIMSKKLWNKCEAETSKNLADRIRTGGSTVWVHNCGDKIYFDAQIDAMDPLGISYACVPHDCESHADCQEKYGDKVTIFGWIAPAAYLFLGTEQELMDECKVECDTHMKGGKYILAPGCEFPLNSNLNMITVMMEAAEVHGKY